MKSIFFKTWVIFVILLLAKVNYADGVFKWKDSNGKIQYGDEPPANVKLDKKFKMPEIMVIDGFKEQWKPLENETAERGLKTTASVPEKQEANISTYTKLTLIAPKENQIITSGFGGEVTAMISIKPPLKSGHKFSFFMDGKEVVRSKSRINNFSNLSAGKHKVVAKVVDRSGRVMATSQSVIFNVVRSH